MTFRELLNLLNSYNLALATISYDSVTIAPKEGSSYRNEAMSILSGESFKILTSPDTQRILKETIANGTELEKKNAIYMIEEIDKIKSIPTQEFIAYQRLQKDGYDAWEQARENKDYEIFKPYLEKLVETFENIISYRDNPNGLSIYDLALDEYEKGLSQEKVDEFFNALTPLISLTEAVINAQSPLPAWKSAYVSVDKQEKIANLIMNHLGYDNSFGYLASTQHPFCSTFSIGDVRITTHYYENDFVSSIFSIIHEVGHAMYNHNVDSSYAGLPFANNMSYSMHESQSRFLENVIGRSKEFWTPLYPKLQEIIPEVLGNVELDEFIQVVNHVDRSIIRTEADELTYPLHILLRYQVEKALFDKDNQENIKDLFNKGLLDNLGLVPDSDREGILQDVHWSDASFGYFPTYALGSAYAAQFNETIRKELDIDQLLIDGDMTTIFAWLKENIHKYSGSIATQDLIIQITGEPFDPKYYVNYLTKKYEDLLGIELD